MIKETPAYNEHCDYTTYQTFVASCATEKKLGASCATEKKLGASCATEKKKLGLKLARLNCDARR